MKYLTNPHEKEDSDFKPDWEDCKIVEENKNKTGWIVIDGVGGLHNRITEDVR